MRIVTIRVLSAVLLWLTASSLLIAEAHAQAWQMWIHSGGTVTRVTTAAIDSVTFVFADTTRPASPLITATTIDYQGIRLDWTAVGDDGNVGTAAAYDLRYATSPGTPFECMTPAPEPVPSPAGSAESFTLGGLAPTTTYFFVLGVLDENGNTARSNEVSATTPADTRHPVIAEVYGAGGNTGATYIRDYVVLFNPRDASVDLSGTSLQWANVVGTGWVVQPLSGTIAAHGYYLIWLASNGPNGAPLPAPNVIGSISMSTSQGKLALVTNTTPLDAICAPAEVLWDFVGWGSPDCYEGAGPAPPASVTNAIIRAGGGCTDTDQNGSDFTAGPATPRNSASPTHTCP